MTEFRTIAPADSSQSPWSDPARPSTLSPSGSSNSTGHSGRTMAGERIVDGGTRRRRRVHGPVSQNACTECRKARSKCDGDKSRQCTRCHQRELKCLYQPHTKIQKDDILNDLDSERERNGTLAEKNSSMSMILDILTNNGHVDEVIKRLRAKEDFESIARWLRTKPELRQYVERHSETSLSLMDVVKRVESLYSRANPDHVDGESHSPAVQWTRVAEGQALIDHLFELYFLWVHPHHMLFSETNFLDCYHRGDEKYCSSALVNAICAMGCHLLDRDVTTSFRDVSDLEKLRLAFMQEARLAISPSDHQDFPTLQAFAVLFLAELSSGKARNAVTYLRCAADNILGQDANEDEDNVLELSRWGIHTLNTLWCGFTYQKPFNPQSPDIVQFFKLDEGRNDLYVYASQHDHLRTPGFAIMTATQQTILFRIVHRSINMYCGASGKVIARKFLECYRDYLEWKDNLPPGLHLNQKGNPLPSVLGLHLQYYTALTEFFLPILSHFDDYDLNKEFRSLILENAREGRAILRKSFDMGLSRFYTPPLTFCAVHICDVIAQCSVDQSERIETAILCLEVLGKNRYGFKISDPLQQMFRVQLEEYGVELPAEIEDRFGPRDQFSVDEILDASTRLSYAQPSSQLVRWLDPNFPSDWRREWHKQMDGASDQQMSDGLSDGTEDYESDHTEHTQTMSGHSMRLDDILN